MNITAVIIAAVIVVLLPDVCSILFRYFWKRGKHQ